MWLISAFESKNSFLSNVRAATIEQSDALNDPKRADTDPPPGAGEF